MLCLTTGNLLAAPCKFQVVTSKTDVDCYGNATGSATAVATGTTGPYRFLWSNGATTATINNLTAETYFVKVTDQKGCEIIEFIEIAEPPKLIMKEEIDHVLCNGDNTGEIRLKVSGGKGDYSYSWSNGNMTKINSPLYAGDYIATVLDGNYCELVDTFTVTEPAKLKETHVITEVSGYGLADGAIDITVNGGVKPYHYQWTAAGEYSDTLEDIYKLRSATYKSRVKDFNDCLLESEIFVPQPPPLEAIFKVTDVNCKHGSDGAIDMTVTGGVPPYTFEWSNPDIVLNEHAEDIKGLKTDWYTVKITDFNDIILEDSVFVNEPSPILANLDPTDANCYASSDGWIDLTVSGGSPPYRFKWSNEDTTQNLTNVTAGKYTVLIVDNNGCSLLAEERIGQPDEIIIDESIYHVTCKDHHDGLIELNVHGGIPGYEYYWSNGKTTPDIANLIGGTYRITITDQHDCKMEEEYTIIVPDIGCIWIPNAFTPNGDGYNDTWEIKNHHLYENISVTVFNKEGYEVFSSAGYNEAWEGYYKGSPMPNGTYYYIVNLQNGDKPFTGTVTIVK